MYTEPELLNERLERLATVLDEIMPNCALLVRDALELLKKQEAQKFFVDESGKITPLPIVFPNCPLKEYEAVVRCKDCKHRPIKPNDYENGFDLEFPDGKCPCQCDDGWYSWYPADNWFCADGERRTNDA